MARSTPFCHSVRKPRHSGLEALEMGSMLPGTAHSCRSQYDDWRAHTISQQVFHFFHKSFIHVVLRGHGGSSLGSSLGCRSYRLFWLPLWSDALVLSPHPKRSGHKASDFGLGIVDLGLGADGGSGLLFNGGAAAHGTGPCASTIILAGALDQARRSTQHA